jgi:hypothetical protein
MWITAVFQSLVRHECAMDSGLAGSQGAGPAGPRPRGPAPADDLVTTLHVGTDPRARPPAHKKPGTRPGRWSLGGVGQTGGASVHSRGLRVDSSVAPIRHGDCDIRNSIECANKASSVPNRLGLSSPRTRFAVTIASTETRQPGQAQGPVPTADRGCRGPLSGSGRVQSICRSVPDRVYPCGQRAAPCL